MRARVSHPTTCLTVTTSFIRGGTLMAPRVIVVNANNVNVFWACLMSGVFVQVVWGFQISCVGVRCTKSTARETIIYDLQRSIHGTVLVAHYCFAQRFGATHTHTYYGQF